MATSFLNNVGLVFDRIPGFETFKDRVDFGNPRIENELDVFYPFTDKKSDWSFELFYTWDGKLVLWYGEHHRFNDFNELMEHLNWLNGIDDPDDLDPAGGHGLHSHI
jgi:hypothetical protein